MNKSHLTAIHTKDKHALRQEWRTPPGLFGELHGIFSFTVDACASHDNCLLPHYWTKTIDAAKCSWANERVWCNPPFKGAGKFFAKAVEAEMACVVTLLNALTARYVFEYPPNYLLVPPKRLNFVAPPGLISDDKKIVFGCGLSLYGTVFDHELAKLGPDWTIFSNWKL